MGETSMIKAGVLKSNPFPGVRPFLGTEDSFFFGREEEVTKLIKLLRDTRFVGLAGPPGVGKSSLIASGLLPALLKEQETEWIPVTIRPEGKPLENLIRAFQKTFPKKILELDVQSFLSGNQGLSELLVEKGLGSHSYFLVVDQFEDLFRTGHSGQRNIRNVEVNRFVDLLVRAVKAERPMLQLLIAIRSDFLDECASFRSLTSLLNKSKYFLPQMDREALGRAIEGPVKQAGASLEAGFVDHLLRDLQDLDFPLPRLQFTLMRTWDHWVEQGDLGRPLSLSDCQSAGSLEHGISDHIEVMYQQLDEGQKRICERIFKTITARSDVHSAYIRRNSLSNIARITQHSQEEVAEVVEVFRQKKHSFLLPGPDVPLAADSLVEIPHESLIRLWGRLQDWVDEEHDSVKMYLKLSEASALYQQGRTELWKPPELDVALQWKKNFSPTPAWGVQYHPAFERAMVFLSTSEEEYRWSEERKVVLQRRRLLLNRALAIFMGLLVVILSVVFFGRGSKDGSELQGQDTEPSVAGEYGNLAASDPGAQEAAAGQGMPEVGNEPTAEEGNPGPGLGAGSPSSNPVTAPNENRTGSQANRIRETTETPRSGDSRNRTSGQGANASPGNSAVPAGSPAAAGKVLLETSARVAEQSLGINRNPELQGLLAYQSYLFHAEQGGNPYDSKMYGALYEATKKLISPAYNIYPNIRNSVKDIQWMRRTGSLLTIFADGTIKILPGNVDNRASQIDLTNTGLANECLVVSPDEKLAAVGTNGGGVLFLELENNGSQVAQSMDHGKIALFMQNLGNTGSFVSAGTDEQIIRWSFSSKQGEVLTSISGRPSALTANKDGSRIAVASRDGKLFEFSASDPTQRKELADFGQNHARSLAYSPGGQQVVAGLLDGTLQVLSRDNQRVLATLKGPAARVSDLTYSPDGRFLAAASHDGKLYLWTTSNWSNPPLVFQENNGFVLAVCFSLDSRFVYSGSVDYPRLVGRPAEASRMADDFCSLLTRNLSQAEWNQYFGAEIPYRKTCPGLNP
ncbi:MAG: AAA family ATPase [Bacteroidales bacterium]